MERIIVQVTTGLTTLKTPAKRINWHNSSDRKWLMNHLHWAMNNGLEVSLAPIESN